jgi:hypothetical protein
MPIWKSLSRVREKEETNIEGAKCLREAMARTGSLPGFQKKKEKRNEHKTILTYSYLSLVLRRSMPRAKPEIAKGGQAETRNRKAKTEGWRETS